MKGTGLGHVSCFLLATLGSTQPSESLDGPGH